MATLTPEDLWRPKLAGIRHAHRSRYVLDCAKAIGIDVRHFVEVGVGLGDNAERVYSLLSAGARLDLIDPWAVDDDYNPGKGDVAFFTEAGRTQRDFDAAYAKVCGRFNWRRGVNIFRGTSAEVLQGLASPHYCPDVVFIDGDHSCDGCMADIDLWGPVLARAADVHRRPVLLAGHDWGLAGVAKALQHRLPAVYRGHDQCWLQPIYPESGWNNGNV